MKKEIDSLHKIIQLLTLTEKKKFRLELSARKKKTNALVMFDFFEAEKEFSLPKYEAFIKRKKLTPIAPVVKSQLKEKLLEWLCQNSQSPAGTNWHLMLAKGEVLMRFELYQEAHEVFTEVKKQAANVSHGIYEWAAITYLSTTMQALEPDKVIDTAIELSNRTVAIGHKLYYMSKSVNFYTRTIAIYHQCRSINQPEQSAQIEQLCREHFMYDDDSFIPMEQAIYIFYARSLIYQMTGNLDKAYQETHKLFSRIMDFEQIFTVHQPQEYVICLREKLHSCIIANNLNEFEQLFDIFNDKALQVVPCIPRYELRLQALKLLHLIKTNHLNRLYTSLQEMEHYKKSDHYKTQTITNVKECMFHEACAYMAINNYEKAITLFENLLNTPAKSVGLDYSNCARFMLLMAEFLLIIMKNKKPSGADYIFISNKSKSLYDYLIKNRIKAPIEKLFINAFKEWAIAPTKTEQKNVLTTLVTKCEKSLTVAPPYYKLQLAEFNWFDHFKLSLQKFYSVQ